MYLNKNKISILLAKNFKSGRTMHVEEAEKGLLCNCVCLKCGEQLKAMKGDIKSWHFSHHTDSNCGGAQETALHRLSKQIILDNNALVIPKHGLIQYSESNAEKQLGNIRPDISAIYNGKPIYFEIAVSHYVDKLKHDFFIKERHNCIEIDLSHLINEIPPLEEVKRIILEEISCKSILYWETDEAYSNPINEAKEESSNDIIDLLFHVAIIAGVIYLIKKYTPRKQRVNKNYMNYKNRKRGYNWA